MYSLIYYVPESDHERVKQALFAQGAGETELYDECCWQTLGTGQFRPKSGSEPAIGIPGKLSKVQEYKVEMICMDTKINQVVATLIQVHPYEQPAYYVTRVKTLSEL
jgi:hypothetical protein